MKEWRLRKISMIVGATLLCSVPSLGTSFEIREEGSAPFYFDAGVRGAPEMTVDGECVVHLRAADQHLNALSKKVDLLEKKVRLLEGKR
jgi:hypothetical protein